MERGVSEGPFLQTNIISDEKISSCFWGLCLLRPFQCSKNLLHKIFEMAFRTLPTYTHLYHLLLTNPLLVPIDLEQTAARHSWEICYCFFQNVSEILSFSPATVCLCLRIYACTCGREFCNACTLNLCSRSTCFMNNFNIIKWRMTKFLNPKEQLLF